MVGVGTVLADDPHLTCRLPGMMERSPVRVVLDARLRVPLSTSVIATAREVPTWVVGGTQASQMAEDILKAKGVEVLRAEAKDGRFDLEGFNTVLKLRAEWAGSPLAKPEKYYDLSYYQKALAGL